MSILEQSVGTLSGVGKTRVEAYGRMGVHTVRDLLYHFPRAYENRGDVHLLSDTAPDIKQSVILTVSTEVKRSRIKGRMNLLKFRAFDDSGVCEITYFNQDYLYTAFPIGATFRFFGKIDKAGKRYTMTSPDFEPWTETATLLPLHPVYPLSEGLSRKMVLQHIGQILEPACAAMEDPLPEAMRLREGLCTLGYALRQIHRPDDYTALQTAKRRLAFDEFFCFGLAMKLAGRTTRTSGAPQIRVPDTALAGLWEQLPYALTEAQKKTVAEIRRDMESTTCMNRIVVGDVGCGKTVCAAAAMVVAVRAGRQAVLMAPTGILAHQHAESLLPLFEKMGIRGALLTGHTTPAQKKKIYAALSAADPSQRLDVVIGTQALLSEGVAFAAPGLVVTDEQHRFGVEQRAVLSAKNRGAHMLFMSATPIPRSLALAVYGDLDVSRIDQMPVGRQRVDTFVVDESFRPRLDAFIRKNVKDGGQVYVVCPSIEEAEESELEKAMAEGLVPLDADFSEAGAILPEREEMAPLRAAVQYAAELQERLPDCRVALVHGRMKQTEKETVMNAFSSGEVDVLVSTTVIEVGVNVPNACLMLIENAERFGLSQLHQLRGRVGRGTRKSYCVLISGGVLGKVARARLETMRTTYDGYAIAEQDLAQRGPGDFLPFGNGAIRQSGGQSWRLAEGWQDADWMNRAFRCAEEILAKDKDLSAHPRLLDMVSGYTTDAERILN